MRRRKRPAGVLAAEIEARRLAIALGVQLREARVRRRLSQGKLAQLVGLSQARISDVETGRGASLPLGPWIQLTNAVGRPLAVSLTRSLDPDDSLSDAGHLDVQEYLMRAASRNGLAGVFELPTRADDPRRSIDVCQILDALRELRILEAWNRFGDLGAAARSTERKVAEAQQLAMSRAVGDARPFDVRVCWVARASAAKSRDRRSLSGDLYVAFHRLVKGMGACDRGWCAGGCRSRPRVVGSRKASPDRGPHAAELSYRRLTEVRMRQS